MGMAVDCMRVIEVMNWPAEVFVVRHIQALNTIPELSLSVFVNSRNVNPAASIDGQAQVPNRVKHVRNFRLVHRLRMLPHPMRELLYRWGDRNIVQHFSRARPDLIHFPFAWYATAFSRYLDKLDIPYTVGFQGSDARVMPLVNHEYYETLCKVLSHASRIHVVCDALGKNITSLCKNHAPIETIRTCLPIPKVIARKSHQSDKLHFVSVGRLYWVKGFHDLIRAVSLLPDAELDIVGDGVEEKEHLTYLIHTLGLQDRVRMLGKLRYKQFESLLESATAYVQSSITEGFSNSLAEAMALGKPVFATRAGGTDEIITDLENGILIPMGDPQGIANKLRLAHDSDLMERIGRSARDTAETEFSEHRHARHFADFFSKALNH